MKKVLLYIIGCSLSVLPLGAQGRVGDNATLTLDSCINLALQNNKTLQSAKKQAERYGYEEKVYKANFFPNFKLSANDAWSDAEGTFGSDIFSGITDGVTQFLTVLTKAGHFTPYEAVVQQFAQGMSGMSKGIDYKVGNIFQAGITLEQPLYMGGKVLTAYQMSKLGKQMADQGAVLSQNEVIVEVQEAYALVVRANEMYKVAVRYDSLLQSLLTDVQNADRHGLRSRNDLLKVQVKLSEAELQVRQAENGQRLAGMNLCHYVGLPLTTQIDVDMEAFSQSPKVLIDRQADVTNRPEYDILAMKSELAAKKVKLERSEYLPQVVLGASYSYVNGIELAGKKLFDKPTAGVLLHVSIPLYHANAGVNKIRSARLEAERAQLEQDDLIEKMNLELAQASNNLDEAYLEVQLAEKSLSQTDENLRSSRSSYDRGTESLSELLEAQTLWQQAYAKLANAKANLFVAATKYQKAAGRL